VTGPKRHLQCCCCGNSAGRWHQWWNRDTGYGICADCVDWQLSRGTTPEEIKESYGVENVNWGRVDQ
jgi:hypothetical protein